jgi:eukaryotic-like serine/threonine-protein kinase
MLNRIICLLVFGLIAQAGLGAVNVPPDADLTVQSPKVYQVFQRSTQYEGPVLMSGRARPDCDAVQIHLTGSSHKPLNQRQWIKIDKVAHSFNKVITVPAGGWYVIDVIAFKGAQEIARKKIDHVGVGEVFVGAGQSNSTNWGEGLLQTKTGMVSSFDGIQWRLANDPQPGVHDSSTQGSFWPAFGDALFNRYGVPIGLAVTGHGGTSVSQWQPGGELYNWTLTRIRELGPQGFRALLWHQGESDVAMTSDQYAGLLTELIRASKTATGWEFPWMVAQASYLSPQAPNTSTTRDAQQALWKAGVALQGPDTDSLTGDNRNNGGAGIHLSVKGLKAHGQMWADKVEAYLESSVVTSLFFA